MRCYGFCPLFKLLVVHVLPWCGLTGTSPGTEPEGIVGGGGLGYQGLHWPEEGLCV